MSRKTKMPDPSTADRVEYLTPTEAKAKGGMLGAIASGVLAHQGWYSYTVHETGEKILLIAR